MANYINIGGTIYSTETHQPIPEDHIFEKGDTVKYLACTLEFIGYLDDLRAWKPVDPNR